MLDAILAVMSLHVVEYRTFYTGALLQLAIPARLISANDLRVLGCHGALFRGERSTLLPTELSGHREKTIPGDNELLLIHGYSPRRCAKRRLALLLEEWDLGVLIGSLCMAGAGACSRHLTGHVSW